MRGQTDRYVRRGAIAAGVVALITVILTGAASLHTPTREWIRDHMQWSSPAYRVGAPSELPPALHADADHTLLIFVASGCEACRRAQSFHLELMRAADGGTRLARRVLLTSPGDHPASYAADIGVPTERVAMIDASRTRVRRVPTILIVDRRGVVQTIKEGVLPTAEQHALIDAVRLLR